MIVPEHIRGDGPCMDCGTVNNIIWFTDSDLWNIVIGGMAAREDPGGILCVTCFVIRVEETPWLRRRGLTGWRLIPEWKVKTVTAPKIPKLPEPLFNPEFIEACKRFNESIAQAFVEANRQMLIQFGHMLETARKEREDREARRRSSQ